MIVIIAPYSPPLRSKLPHLGAARKIEAVIGMLSQLGLPLVLINTSHEYEKPAPLITNISLINDVSLTEVTPPTYSNRKKGKLLNLFDISQVVNAVLKLGHCKIVWLYNGYAMESRLGIEFHRQTECFLIQEMEDWHFSRNRGINPKPFIDWWFWRGVSRKANHIFSVNDALGRLSRKLNSNVSLFPGVVGNDIVKIRSKYRPFSSCNDSIIVGYFGGLFEEKGAQHILALYRNLPTQFRFISTGAGPMENDFREIALKSDGRFEFHGQVDNSSLTQLIARCDVLLNPHSSIADMANGVFPFKIIESIASGRMLISTPLPSEELDDVLQGVCFSGHDIFQLQQALTGAHAWFLAHESQINAGADAAVRRFSTEAILDVVKQALKEQVP